MMLITYVSTKPCHQIFYQIIVKINSEFVKIIFSYDLFYDKQDKNDTEELLNMLYVENNKITLIIERMEKLI